MTNTPTDAEIDEVTLDVLGYAALDKETNDTARMIARAVLAKWGTQPQAGAVPQRWKAVPVNPTPEMWKAAKTVPDPNPPYPPHYGLVWDAMLAASPTPPAEQQAAQVIIDFSQVGTAGPFPVVNGRVSLPDATMQDLARMLRPTYEAEQQAEPGAVGRTGCAAGTDEECTRRGCATSCPAQQAAPKAAPGEPFDECFPGEPRVAVPQGLISAACFAIRNKRDGGKVLEQLRRYSVGDLSQPLAPQQEAQEPVAWESTTPGYIKYITQARYEKFSPAVRRWYKPYRCSGCAERGAGFDACDMATAAAQGFRSGQAAAKQEG